MKTASHPAPDAPAPEVQQPPGALRPTADSLLALFVAEYGGGALALDVERFGGYAQRMVAASARQAAAPAVREVRGGIAVIPLHGVLVPKTRQSWFGTIPGMDRFRADVAAALANPDVTAIVLDVDSPGGTVMGTPETAAAVASAAAKKPVVAAVTGLMASAAYYIGSQAREIVAMPSAMVGSIGVRAMHVDESKMIERYGLKVTTVAAGKYKNEMSPFAPLSEDGLAFLQQQVDDAYDQFVAAVASGRGVSEARVRNGFGEGRVLDAGPALKEKMIDRLGAVEDAIAQLASGKSRAWRKRSALPFL